MSERRLSPSYAAAVLRGADATDPISGSPRTGVIEQREDFLQPQFGGASSSLEEARYGGCLPQTDAYAVSLLTKERSFPC